MTIWIVALALLGALGGALALASFAPALRRRPARASAPAGQPLFFQRHEPPPRPALQFVARLPKRAPVARHPEKG
ncbi:MAG: hypothetical protein FJY75_10255 [Candidatus Eisenbacteria bacterium]|uniref:Uncharacterized protein n=1 Tax=Eiseniibacteriota bacterium TaxID=2212470 RepID=A0A937XC31_UNCEI|nr:hypothetical protein [Candidatus Eisenbacteria bacterium]